jgi:hypothetical protein
VAERHLNLYIPDFNTTYQSCLVNIKPGTGNKIARNREMNQPSSGHSKYMGHQYPEEKNEETDGQEIHLGH